MRRTHVEIWAALVIVEGTAPDQGSSAAPEFDAVPLDYVLDRGCALHQFDVSPAGGAAGG